MHTCPPPKEALALWLKAYGSVRDGNYVTRFLSSTAKRRNRCSMLSVPISNLHISTLVNTSTSRYRKASVGSHFLYFKSNDSGKIAIIRILHQRMDVESHL